MPLKIGAMNNPQRDAIKEIKWFHDSGFDFVDLTIEPVRAGNFDVIKAKKALRATGIGIVGHTTPFLPFALPVEGMRRVCMKEFERCMDIFSRLGAEYVNIHPTYNMPFHQEKEKIDANISFFSDFSKAAQRHNLIPMIENFIRPFDSVETFRRVFDEIPGAMMHLDIGHANIRQETNLTGEFFRAFGRRIVHLHASDNKGEDDDHLPIGCGNIDWAQIRHVLKKNGYSGTVTLEVFSNDRDYLLLSQLKFRQLFQ